LPNIKGEYHDVLTDVNNVNTSIGALWIDKRNRIRGWSWNNDNNEIKTLKFSAAMSEQIYKENCGTIRPKSYGVYMWIRTA